MNPVNPKPVSRVTAWLARCADALSAAAACRVDLGITLFAFGIFLVGLLWGVVVLKVRAEREGEIAAAMTHTANLARVFEEHTVRTLHEADQVLLFIAHQYAEHGTQLDLRRMVEDSPVISRIYNVLSIADEHGNQVLGSVPFLFANVADREHFQAHVAHEMPNTLFIGKSVTGRVTGKPTIHLSRRINKPDLSFGGVAVASVDAGYFSKLYDDLNVGKQGVVTLVGRDGIVRARRAGGNTRVGQDLSKSSVFQHLKASERGSYLLGAAVTDGASRIISYRSLRDYPLVVVVGFGTDEALAGFYQRKRDYYRGAALISGVIMVFTMLFVSLLSRQGRLNATLRRLSQALEQSATSVVITDTMGRIEYVNPMQSRLTGYAAGELLGRNPRIWQSGKTRPEVYRELWETLRSGKVWRGDVQNRKKSGELFWEQKTISPLADGNGRITHYVAVGADITDQKRAEAEHAQLAAIVESSGDAIISRGLDGVVLTFNKAAERMFGWSARDAIGQPVTIIVPPERRGENRPLIERIKAGEIVEAIESEHRRKDGSRITTSLSASAIRNTQGETTAVSLIFRDVTERKRLEREALAKTRLTRLLEALARTANEASGTDDALRRSLEHICEYGRWTLGCVGTLGTGDGGRGTHKPSWHCADSVRYAEFMTRSDNTGHTSARGYFIGRVLREKQSVWISDTAQVPSSAGRMAFAARCGLRSAFAFPVVLGGEVAAFLEFFAAEPREPNRLLMEATGAVAAQLARLMERERAQLTNARLAAIVRSADEAILSISREGTILSWNAGAEALFGYPADEALGQSNVILYPEEEAGQFPRNLELALNAAGSRQYEAVRRTKDGRRVHVAVTVFPIEDDTGQFLSLGVFYRDITERKRAQEKVEYLANYDAVTGLPNRDLFRDRLNVAFAHARRRGEVLGVMAINLDRFKKVNESLGNDAGDELLREVAVRFKDSLREMDTIARLGGNDYAVLVEGVAAAGDVTAVAEKLIQALAAAPFTVRGQEIFIEASIGIAVYPNGIGDSQGLLEHAEIAMRRVKQEGGGDCQLFEGEPITLQGRRLTIETRLRHALENGELAVHYQPKVSLRTGAVTGAEALVRWTSPQLGAMSPAQFIPLAEETGLIVPIGAWVLQTACEQAAAWRKLGHDLAIAVNLSPRQFRQRDLVNMVSRALERSGLDARHLELEITEGTAMSNAEQTIAVLAELHRLGVNLAVDDFGTGYSSLGYLNRFPLHCLKIDRSFVRDVSTDPNSNAIVRATIALAHSLNLRVVAEGVETVDQRDILALIGCDEAQGYLYGRPVPTAELGTLLNGGKLERDIMPEA